MWDGVDEDDELVLYAFQRPGPGVGARAVGCQCRLYYTRSADGEKVCVCQGLDVHSPCQVGRDVQRLGIPSHCEDASRLGYKEDTEEAKNEIILIAGSLAEGQRASTYKFFVCHFTMEQLRFTDKQVRWKTKTNDGIQIPHANIFPDVPAETVYYRAQAAMKRALIADALKVVTPDRRLDPQLRQDRALERTVMDMQAAIERYP
mmetsp:Transcript_19128/g.56326  ORF Transcript_19128/g.56326 Transcript_19128/m.56326 type:complete len:204 (+) Transcript_19128:196-807(+)